MAVPWASLVAQRSRVLPQGGAILGRLSEGLRAGYQEGQQRAAENAAPDVFLNGLDALYGHPQGSGGAAPTLGNLAPSTPAARVPFDGTPSRENAATWAATTPGQPTFDGRPTRQNAAAYDATHPPQQPAAGSNYRDAISGIESGGDYSLLGPIANASGDRAYGRYQVMGENIGPWTQQVLGYAMTPQQFLASPQAQDAVFDAIFGGYVQQYGPEGAARAWFTGSPTGTGADVLGTTADHYVEMFTGGGGGAGGVATGGGQAPRGGGYTNSAPGWTPPTDQERAALRAMILNPVTREQGMALAIQRMTPPAPATPSYGFTEVNGVLYATDPTTGQARAVTQPQAGTAKPPETQDLVGPDGRMHTFGWNPQSGRYDIDYGQSATGTTANREVRADANGVPRYVDNGEQVFPDVQATPTAQPVRTLLNQADGQLHDYMFNPATNAFDLDQGLADPGGQWTIGVGADGAVTMTQGRGVPNANEDANYRYYSSASAADPIINQFTAAGTDVWNNIWSGMGIVGNAIMPTEGQQFYQAVRTFINAVLRRDSGAVISDSEFANARAQYIPAPFDSPEVLAQKAADRAQRIAALQAGSGRQAQPAAATPSPPPSIPAGAPAAYNAADGTWLYWNGTQWVAP